MWTYDGVYDLDEFTSVQLQWLIAQASYVLILCREAERRLNKIHLFTRFWLPDYPIHPFIQEILAYLWRVGESRLSGTWSSQPNLFLFIK